MEDDNQAEIAGNKCTVRALYEDVLSNGRIALLRELLAPEYPGGATGIELIASELRAAFPDIQYVIEELLAEGDRVAVRWRWTGTHRAPFRGFPASGKAISNNGLAIYTLRGGRITGVVLETDRLGFLQQLGVVSPDAALRASATAPVIDVGRAPAGLYLIDTFSVPAAARAEFEAAARRNREYIRTLDGFRGDAVFVRQQGDAAFDVATIAAWDSPAALARAKAQVSAFYQRIGFDMPAAIAGWGVSLQRAICAAPAALQ